MALWNSATGDGVGATDHGELTGLADDDHSQYHNDTRGDARYSLLGHNHDASYAAAAHAHEGTEIDATGVTDGYVLTADGAGNAAWEAAAGGGLSSGDTAATLTITELTIGDGSTTTAGMHFSGAANTGVYKNASYSCVTITKAGSEVMRFGGSSDRIEAFQPVVVKSGIYGASFGASRVTGFSTIWDDYGTLNIESKTNSARNINYKASGSGALHYFYSNGVVSAVIDGSSVRPANDSGISCGTASQRFSEVFAATGTINTSDAREKTVVTPLTTDEINAAKQLASEIGTYQFLASVAAKGEAARHHIGMTVQRAIEIMTANNLDPMRYGFICYDSWGDEYKATAWDANDPNVVTEAELTREAGDRYSFRPDQLALFVLRGIEARLSAAGL